MPEQQGAIPYGSDAVMVPDGQGGFRLQYTNGRPSPQIRFFRRPDGSFATTQNTGGNGQAFNAVPRLDAFTDPDPMQTSPNGTPLNTYGLGPEQTWFNPWY